MPRKPTTPAATTPPAAVDVDQWIDALPPRPTTTVALPSDLEVTVRQLTDAEVGAAVSSAATDDVVGRELAVLAAACMSPAFTAAQLERLRTRDLAGERAVTDLFTAAALLRQIDAPTLSKES